MDPFSEWPPPVGRDDILIAENGQLQPFESQFVPMFIDTMPKERIEV